MTGVGHLNSLATADRFNIQVRNFSRSVRTDHTDLSMPIGYGSLDSGSLDRFVGVLAAQRSGRSQLG